MARNNRQATVNNKTNNHSDIDVVIAWVDANDPQWQKDYKKHYKDTFGTDAKLQKYQEIGTLKYLFRGIETFMPWVNKIHLMTYGHFPEWLKIDHPKLNLINHKDFFKTPEAVPVFNANAIEVNIHRIPGLKEKFIYFNDDMLVLGPIKPERFFEKNLPKDFMVFAPLIYNIDSNFGCMLYTDMTLIHRLLDKYGYRKWWLKNLTKIFNYKYGITWNLKNLLSIFIKFPLFKLYHFPQPYLKSSFVEVEKIFPRFIEEIGTHRFKKPKEVNQYLFRFYNLISGKFTPYKPTDMYWAAINTLQDFYNHIEVLNNGKNKYNFVCFNDNTELPLEDYPKYKRELTRFLDSKLPKKSSFEL